MRGTPPLKRGTVPLMRGTGGLPQEGTFHYASRFTGERTKTAKKRQCL